MAHTPSDPYVQRQFIDAGLYRRHVDAYQHHLIRLDYAEYTVGVYVTVARHFCHWLCLSGEPLSGVTGADLNRFAGHNCVCTGARRRGPLHGSYVRRARTFLRFLAETGVIQVSSSPSALEAPETVAWLVWLRRHKGLSTFTLKRYKVALNELLPLIGTDPTHYEAAKLRSVFSATCLPGKEETRRLRATALRSWVRYNAALGRCASALAIAVPSVSVPRRDNVPRGLKSSDLNRLLASCDTTRPIGLRDFAVLLLAARLGLRAHDVSSLTLNQIDWKQGHLRVVGKGRREAVLPLPQEVGDAILAWLKFGRPPLDDPHVFLCMVRPWRPFATSRVVSQIVARAITHAGLTNTPSGGANLLRHSVACGLVEDGATMETIATLLRHQSIETTSIYAKADPKRLREIAQPWPGAE